MRGFSGTVLVGGGIYGNWQAFEALLAAAARHGVGVRNIILTGDLVAYCADGAAVSEFCRTQLGEALVVRGNCERALAAGEEDCGCGFLPGSVCSALSGAWYAHAVGTVSADCRRWFGRLPAAVRISLGGRRLAVIHGGAWVDNTFIFGSAAAGEKRRHAAALGVEGVIAGHCGIPHSCVDGGVLWHNSGAVGMPANDGTARGWYSLLSETAAGIVVRHLPLEYDVAAAQAAMVAAGLPSDYRVALGSGVWPSDSVLPPEERRRQGRALVLGEVLFAR